MYKLNTIWKCAKEKIENEMTALKLEIIRVQMKRKK